MQKKMYTINKPKKKKRKYDSGEQQQQQQNGFVFHALIKYLSANHLAVLPPDTKYKQSFSK